MTTPEREPLALPELGKVLRLLRALRGLTIAELAKASNSSVSFISDLEHGRKQPGLRSMLDISNALHIPAWTILAAAEEPNRTETTAASRRASIDMVRSRIPPAAAASAFQDLLSLAATRVEDEWFLIPSSRSGEHNAQYAYRERIYCYELYHQIRTLQAHPLALAAGSPVYTLSGELDKAGLNAVIDDSDAKPDLLWHIPGDATRNAAIVEVKTVIGLGGVKKDIRTLVDYTSNSSTPYASGILLVVGRDFESRKTRERVSRGLNAYRMSVPDQRAADVTRIRVLHHEGPLSALHDLGSLAAMETS